MSGSPRQLHPELLSGGLTTPTWAKTKFLNLLDSAKLTVIVGSVLSSALESLHKVACVSGNEALLQRAKLREHLAAESCT